MKKTALLLLLITSFGYSQRHSEISTSSYKPLSLDEVMYVGKQKRSQYNENQKYLYALKDEIRRLASQVEVKEFYDYLIDEYNDLVKIEDKDLANYSKYLMQTADNVKDIINDYNNYVRKHNKPNLEKDVQQKPISGSELSEVGENLYKQKKYDEAIKVFSLAVRDKSSKTFFLDNMYLGNSVLFYVSLLQGQELSEEQIAENTEWLQIADRAYAEVISFSFTTQDAHVNKAKINRLIGSDEALLKAVESYENYIQIVNDKGEAELSNDRTKRELLAGYMFLGAEYTKINDKTKAIDYFQSALNYNPSNEQKNYIMESINVLRGR